MIVLHVSTDDVRGNVEIEKVARNKGFMYFHFPDKKFTDENKKLMRTVVDKFLAKNKNPAYIFVVKLIPELFISDDAVYIGKKYLLDKDNMIPGMIKTMHEWLYVKDDDISTDPATGWISDGIIRERGLLVATAAFSIVGMKNFLKLVESLHVIDQGST
jgi:hypothetical protein